MYIELCYSPLSSTEYRYFWVAWNHGAIWVGAGEQIHENQFMEYTDPTPLVVRYIGLGSCCGATGSWILGEGNIYFGELSCIFKQQGGKNIFSNVTHFMSLGPEE